MQGSRINVMKKTLEICYGLVECSVKCVQFIRYLDVRIWVDSRMDCWMHASSTDKWVFRFIDANMAGYSNGECRD